jgi:uncharacterized membrane protein
MKTVILCFLMLVSIAAIPQNNHSIVSEETSNSLKIDKLQKAVVRIENEIQNKTDSLAILREEIEHIENQEYLAKFNQEAGEFSFFATLRMNGDIQVSPNAWDETIANLSKGDTIKITDYINGYWKASKGQVVGYVHDIFLTQTEELIVFKTEMEKKSADLQKKEAAEKEKEAAEKLERYKALDLKKRKDYEESIIIIYGDEVGQKLLNGYYWIGMTEEMARISLGDPTSINRTVGSWGIHEQWVYHRIYLYFENGKLASYQNSR